MRRVALGICLAAAAGCGRSEKADLSSLVEPPPASGFHGGASDGGIDARASASGPDGDAGAGGLGGGAAVAPRPDGGTAGAGGVAGAGGESRVACGTAGGPSDGGGLGGASPAVTAEPIPVLAPCRAPPVLSTALQLAPVDPGQRYVRCGTHGPERGWQITISPGGRYLAARTAAGTVRLIDLQRWREIVQLASPLGKLNAVAFSPDGRHLAALSAEAGQVTLWRTADGSLEQSWALAPTSGMQATSFSLAFSPDGRLLASSLGTPGTSSASGASPVSLLRVDPAAPPVIESPTVNPEVVADGAAFPFVTFVGGDATALVDETYQIGDSNLSRRLALVQAPCGPDITLFQGYVDSLRGYAVSPDGQLVAFSAFSDAGLDGLQVVRGSMGAAVASQADFDGQVLAFSPDGMLLYVQQGDVITALDPTTLRPLRSFSVDAGAVFKAIAPSGQLVTTNASATEWWDPITGLVTRTLAFPIDQMVWSRDGSVEVETGGGFLFRVVLAANGNELCSAPAAGAAVTNVAMSALGGHMAYGYDDGTVDVGGADAMAGFTRFATSLGSVSGLAVSDDGRRAAVQGQQPLADDPSTYPLAVFDTASGARLARLDSPAYRSELGVFSPDGTKYAMAVEPTGSVGWETHVVDAGSGELLLDIQSSGGTLPSYAVPDLFSPDSTELAVERNGLEVIRLADGASVKTFAGEALSPSWSLLAGGSTGLSVTRTFDGGVVATFSAGSTRGTFFAAGDQLIATRDMVVPTHGADPEALYVWDVQSGTEMRIFPPTAPTGAGPLALPGDGAQMVTLDSGVAAVWCR